MKTIYAKEVSSASDLFDLGLTYGVNTIKDDSISHGLSTKKSNAFDLNAFSDSDIGKTHILSSNSCSNRSENINEVIKECNENILLVQNLDSDILGRMFTLGYKNKFKLVFKYKDDLKKYQYYYVQKQYVTSYNYQSNTPKFTSPK